MLEPTFLHAHYFILFSFDLHRLEQSGHSLPILYWAQSCTNVNFLKINQVN